MKTQKMTLALAVFAGLTFGSVYAQSEDQVLNSEQIDVDGYLKEQNVTDGELEQIKGELGKQKNMTQLNKEKAKELGKLSGQTEKLLESQDQYIDEKIESQKAIKEFNKKTAENEKKLKCLLEESKSPECSKWVKNKEPMVEDSISTGQASVAKIEAAAPVASSGPKNAFEEIKLMPFAGVTNFQGEAEKLETSFAGGLRLESNVTDRLSMGVGLNYGVFETEDFANTYLNQPYYGQYFNQFGRGRKIDYSNIGVDFYAKFFLTRGERFRPYLGAGLGYNRMTLAYKDQSVFSSFGQSFGNEELTNSYATGILMGGTELRITNSIGMNVELQYSRGFGAGTENTGVNPFNAPDQRRLQSLSEEIINSNAISIFAGMVVTF